MGHISSLIAAMESLAPPQYAESWDNVGLLLGDPAAALQGPVLLTIDLNDAVASEAIELKAGAIISYHPPIFRPITSLTAISMMGATLLRLARAGIAVYSPHTALDNAPAPGSLTDWLLDQALTEDARPDAGRDRRVLVPAAGRDPSQTHKLVTFIPTSPPEVLERIRTALASAGAGIIGSYESCSFTSAGRGSFRGNEASNPVIGRPGNLEFVNELRLEMVCPARRLPEIIAALRGAHPYEEPAFDLYELAPPPAAGRSAAGRGGAGRIAMLDQPSMVVDIAQRLIRHLGLSHVLVTSPGDSPQRTPGMQRAQRRPGGSDSALSDQPPAGASSTPPSVLSVSSAVKALAAVPGSGASLLDAAIAAGADCFITGEMKHHEVLGALARGCSVILCGHTETERPYLRVLADRLHALDPSLSAVVSTADRAPLAILAAEEWKRPSDSEVS